MKTYVYLQGGPRYSVFIRNRDIICTNFSSDQPLVTHLIHEVSSLALEQGATRVSGLTVRLGSLSHISSEHFREHFNHASQGTIAEGAQLTINVLRDETEAMAQEVVLESIEVEDK
ncbi:MAG: hydrogenase/urease maturation nickel metallochaperone HypA [Candidatus Brocadiaceae bacterium]